MPAADLQLDWLRAFVAVVDAGSLTAAAPHVHRSQSALSMVAGLLGCKVGMTQVYDAAGAEVPVTVVKAGPCSAGWCSGRC